MGMDDVGKKKTPKTPHCKKLAPSRPMKGCMTNSSTTMAAVAGNSDSSGLPTMGTAAAIADNGDRLAMSIKRKYWMNYFKGHFA